MPVVLLIRHGENDYVKKGRLAGRLPGVHLNQHGREQAQALAEKLTGAPVKAIYSSPLERAMETAEPIAKALDVPVITRQGLIEVDVGEWQDKKLKGLSRLKAWRLVQNAPSIVRFPEGETFLEAQCRIASELLSLAEEAEAAGDKSEAKDGKEKRPPEIIVCVSHSDPIKLAVAYFIGLPLDHFQRLAVAPASITALYIGGGGSRLLALNYDLSFTLSKS